MRRKYLYLLGSLASIAKPFILGSLAVSLGLTDSGGTTSSFLRYLLFPQLVPAVCLFFLFLDRMKYDAYRPLVALVCVGSTFLFILGVVSGTRNIGSLFLHVRDLASFARGAFAVLAIDLFDLIALVLGKSALSSMPREERGTVGAGQEGGKNVVLPSEEQK
jgi:hypothetical protein